MQLEDDSETEGRRHTATSVSKTRFSSRTPTTQREAIQQLRQRISFSDQSVSLVNGVLPPTHPPTSLSRPYLLQAQSSTASTPQKKAPPTDSTPQGTAPPTSGSPATAPAKLQGEVAVATFAPVTSDGSEGAEYMSEGEISSSVSAGLNCSNVTCTHHANSHSLLCAHKPSLPPIKQLKQA